MTRPVVLRTVLCASLLLTVAQRGVANDAAWAPRNDPARIQALVDELLLELAIPDKVQVVLVAANPLLVSIESQAAGKAFLLSVEDAFLDVLNQDELRAVVAHELGHVWIFTHHPYLQTEQLANRIAMRVVSRDVLERVYGKVWERSGTKGDLVRFLGH